MAKTKEILRKRIVEAHNAGHLKSSECFQGSRARVKSVIKEI